MVFRKIGTAAGALVGCILVGAAGIAPAMAEMTDAEMQMSFGQAEIFGRVMAEADACGSDMSAIAGLYDRAWTCQGASSNQLVRIKAELAGARARSKTTVCTGDKAGQDKKIAAATTRLEAELKELPCKK